MITVAVSAVALSAGGISVSALISNYVIARNGHGDMAVSISSENNGGAVCDAALCIELYRLCGDVTNMMLSRFHVNVRWHGLARALVGSERCELGVLLHLHSLHLHSFRGIFVEQASWPSRQDRELI